MSTENAPKRPRLAIVNSSSFGKHFQEHLTALEAVGDVHRVDVPKDISMTPLIDQLRGVNGIVASVTPRFPAEVLERLPELVMIARHGIGCDNVDLEAATTHGILVSKVEGIVEQEAVAEHAIALMLSAGRFIDRKSVV